MTHDSNTGLARNPGECPKLKNAISQMKKSGDCNSSFQFHAAFAKCLSRSDVFLFSMTENLKIRANDLSWRIFVAQAPPSPETRHMIARTIPPSIAVWIAFLPLHTSDQLCQIQKIRGIFG